ncbi:MULTISPECIES: hypothetical protein [unclassified Xanthomonas]|uniref:hypothetical protein n=1 Tax=unclassified Xanthomonas TaxID=2643310 RepID=UPI002883031D|nr:MULTISPECIES: hypothetical protein [unclassified Xanthomonas]
MSVRVGTERHRSPDVFPQVLTPSVRLAIYGLGVAPPSNQVLGFLNNTQGDNGMKVSIKDLSVTMELGNNGVTFDVYGNDETFLGDLRLGRGKVEWCKGRTKSGNGIQVSWTELLAFFDEIAAKKVAKKAAKKGTKKVTKVAAPKVKKAGA